MKLFLITLVVAVIVVLGLGSCGTGGASPDLWSSMNSNQMTANSALQNAQWQASALTATAGAPIVRITETAAAITVQAAQAQATSQAGIATQGAAQTATAVWWTPTPNATGTLEALAISAAQTQTTLNLETSKSQNELWKIAPQLAVIVAVFLIGFFMISYARQNRFKPAAADANGNILPVIDTSRGTFTDIDRSPNFQGSISQELFMRVVTHLIETRLNMQPLLPPVTAERQDKVVERDQITDLATRGMPGQDREPRRAAVQQANRLLTGPTLESRFKILDGTDQELPVLDGHIVQVLDNEWKETEKK